MKRTLLALLVGLSLLLSLGRLRQRADLRPGGHRAGPYRPAGPGRAGPAPVLEHRRPEPGRPGRPLPGRGGAGPLRRGHRRPGPGHDPAPLLAGDLRPGGPRRRHGLRHRLPHQPGHGPGGGPVPPGGLFRRLELRPPGRRPAAHGGGDDPAVPPDPHRPVEPGGAGHRTTTVEVPSPWWTASGRSPPDEAVVDALLGACSPQGRPLTSLLEESAA